MRSDVELLSILQTPEIQSGGSYFIVSLFYITEEKGKGGHSIIMKTTIVSAWHWVSTVQIRGWMKFCAFPLLPCSVYFKIQVKIQYVVARFKVY